MPTVENSLLSDKPQNKSQINTIFVLCFLLFITFFSANSATSNNGVVIPFVKFNTTYLVFGLIIVCCIAILFNLKLKIDILCPLLFSRIILCLIPLLYMEAYPTFVGRFTVACFPFFIYLIFLNFSIDIKKISKIFIALGIVLSIQCFCAYTIIVKKGYASYSSSWYKDFFVIPIGATNDLSAILIPLLIFGDLTIDNGSKRWLYNFAIILSIFLCKSRTGVILTGLYFVIRLFLKSRDKYQTIKLILMVMACITLSILLLSHNSRIFHFMIGYAQSGSITMNRLFSGRLDIFATYFQIIKSHMIFGNGVCYEQVGIEFKPHNIILQILYENGILGLLIFSSIATVSIKRIIRARRDNKYYYAFSIALPFIFINALVEDVLLTYFMELFCLVFLASIKQTLKSHTMEDRNV